MTEHINQNPEQKARDLIDQMLTDAGWAVQSKGHENLSAARGQVPFRTKYAIKKNIPDYHKMF
ncbi:MAG: hypothetical protein R3D58_22385 [Saprospiraceae bacterium]|jgi:type I site-specific restriction endonuclease